MNKLSLNNSVLAAQKKYNFTKEFNYKNYISNSKEIAQSKFF
jgi:hypothetical protein